MCLQSIAMWIVRLQLAIFHLQVARFDLKVARVYYNVSQIILRNMSLEFFSICLEYSILIFLLVLNALKYSNCFMTFENHMI